jgi:hypothetical protein
MEKIKQFSDYVWNLVWENDSWWIKSLNDDVYLWIIWINGSISERTYENIRVFIGSKKWLYNLKYEEFTDAESICKFITSEKEDRDTLLEQILIQHAL